MDGGRVDEEVLMSEKMWGSEPFWGLGYEWDPSWVLTDRQQELRALLIELYRDEDQRASLIAKLPRFTAANVVIAPFAPVCEAAEKQAVVAVLTPIASSLDNGAHVLATTVEQIDRCIARRAALGPKLDALL